MGDQEYRGRGQAAVELGRDLDVETVRRTIEAQPEVESSQTLLVGNGWLVHQGRLQACEFFGVEDRVPRWFPGAAGVEVKGVILPDSLAFGFGVETDSTVRVVSPRPTLTPFARQIPRSRSFRVQTVFSAGRSDVRHVFVGGRQVVRDRRLTGLDLDATLADAAALTPRIAASVA